MLKGSNSTKGDSLNKDDKGFVEEAAGVGKKLNKNTINLDNDYRQR